MTDHNAFRQSAFLPPPAGQSSLLGNIAAVIVGALLLVAGFMFSVVALAVIATVGLGVWAWLWWKTRALRRQIAAVQADAGPAHRHRTRPMPEGQGLVIEGEIIRRE